MIRDIILRKEMKGVNMVLNYYQAQSGIYPENLDTTSSKSVVYIRKNIQAVEKQNESNGEFYTVYEYDEAKVSKEFYAQHKDEIQMEFINKQRADIDYIALMSGIDLEAGV